MAVCMMLAVFSGCTGSEKPIVSTEAQKPEDIKLFPTLMTIAETAPDCATFEYDDKKQPYCFYAYDTEGKLYRVLWTDFTRLGENDLIAVYHNNEFKKTTYEEHISGMTPQYEVRATDVRIQKKADRKNTYSHITIFSGGKEIYPFSCETWMRIDNMDGTHTETFFGKYDVIDLVCGKTTFSTEDIPSLVLNLDVTYCIQFNGDVKKVYLLTPDGDRYTKTETTLEVLSVLPEGTYYVVLDVLLSGNCNPEAPQNSYRYEDVFRLIAGEGPTVSDEISYSEEDGDKSVQKVMTDADKETLLNILRAKDDWSRSVPDETWNYRFVGRSLNIGYFYSENGGFGVIADFIGNRFSILTDEEKKSIEALISHYTDYSEPPEFEEVPPFEFDDGATSDPH